jgi:archaellum component FlaC
MALVNKDVSGKNEYNFKKQLITNQKQEINTIKMEIDGIKNDISDIKNLMVKLLEKG